MTHCIRSRGYCVVTTIAFASEFVTQVGSRVSSDSISRTGMCVASGKLFEIHSSLVLGGFGGEI